MIKVNQLTLYLKLKRACNNFSDHVSNCNHCKKLFPDLCPIAKKLKTRATKLSRVYNRYFCDRAGI